MRALWRGLRRRCPRCGHGRLFRRYFELVPRCPGCGLRFEREEGYWAGALIVNIAAVMLAFFAVFVGGMILFWPDVRWGWLLFATVAVNGIVPIAFYPHSKTIWMALDVLMHRMDRGDHSPSGNGAGRGTVVRRGSLRPDPPSREDPPATS